LIPDDVPPGCFPQDTYSPINTIALSRDGDTQAYADPGLVERGEVGLLTYAGTTSAASTIADTAAEPEVGLGGNLPGLVVPPTGSVATHFKLRPSGTSTIALLDFGSLTGRSQSSIRSAVSRLAPGAQTADGTLPGVYENERSVAGATALSGAALVLLVLLFGGGAVLAAHRQTLRSLVDTGASLHVRRRLALRWTIAPVLSLLLAIPLNFATTAVAGLNAPGSAGTLWVVPYLTGLVACAALFVMFLRVPDRGGE